MTTAPSGAAPSPPMDELVRSPTALAYLAGILDGEGCLRIARSRLRRRPNNSPRHWPVLFVGNVSWLLCEYLRQKFGGSISTRPATSRHREFYLWALTTREAVLSILTAVRPYLLVKGGQADLLIEFIVGFRSHKGGGRGRGRRLSPDELARRERICEEVKALNHASRGPLPGAPRVPAA